MRAMILAAGMGTRLKPLTDETAKPMVPIVNRPAMEHLIEHLSLNGFRKIVINLHYRKDAIKEYFEDGSQWKTEIVYSEEDELMGTAGGLKNVEKMFSENTFIVASGDALTDIDMIKLLEYHREKGGMATIVATEVDDPSKYGILITGNDKRIEAFQEKPQRSEALSNVANSGIYVFEPEIFKLIPEQSFYDFGRDLFPAMLEMKIPFYSYEHNEYWNDVGSIEEYRRGNFDALEGRVRVKIAGVRMGDRIWIGDSTVIEDDVVLVGPICIGRDCHVKKGAKLYGPLIIGDKTVIDEGAVLYRGIKWGDTYVGKDASILDSIVANGTEIGHKASILADTVIGGGSRIDCGAIVRPSATISPGTVFTGENAEKL